MNVAVHRTSSPTARADLQRASADDAARLATLAAAAFPRSLRWSVNHAAATRTWRAILSSSVAEVWISCRPDALTGLLLLVIDESAWSTSSASRPSLVGAEWLGLARRPGLLMERFRRKRRHPAVGKDPVATVPPTQSVHRVWIELIAVHPSQHGTGLAKQFEVLAEQRARALDRRAIGLQVNLSNARAIRFYEKLGFRRTHKAGDSINMEKTLDRPKGMD